MICNICNKIKDKIAFRNAYKRKDGSYSKRKQCIICENEINKKRSKEYYYNNRQSILEYSASNEGKAKRKETRNKNIEHYKKQRKNSQIKYRDSRIEYNKIWKEKNIDHIKNYNNRPEIKIRQKLHTQKRRKHIKERSDGSINVKSIQGLFLKQNNKCVHCKIELDAYHIDHIQPISKLGLHIIKNIQILCPTCNLKKGNRYNY